MPFGLKDTDCKLIKTIFQLFPKIAEVIVFGSRAMGTEKPGSDVDLALKGNDITLDDILKLKHKLEELPIIYDFDIISYATINTTALIEHIDRHGIQFYIKQEIPKEWRTYKLGDFAEINPKITLKRGQEYSFVEMKNLDATFKYVSPSIKKELKGGSKFQTGDTLFARITPCLENGKICQVKNLENNFGFGSTEFLVFRGKRNISDNDFVYYLTRSDFVKNNAIQLMTGSSGRQRVEKSLLEELEIVAPKSIETQTQIAQILSSLDDKIELNLQMNQTIEAMAQAIFKEWFVDFKFPDFDGQLVNGVPKGWRKGNLNEIMYVQNGYAFKSTDFIDEGKSGILKIKNISNNVVDIVNMQFISNEVAMNIDKRFKVEGGDLLIAMTGAEVGKVGIVPNTEKKLWLNQRVGSFKEKVKYSKWFCYLILSTNEYQNILLSTASGSAQPNISANQIERTEIILPSLELIEEFGMIVNSLFEKILENYSFNQTLTQTRDTLLPKLMSGQIEI